MDKDMHELTRELHHKNDSKIVMIVADGLGGLPMAPGALTELETAQTPNLNALAARGVQGLSIPVKPGIAPGSGPGHLGLFGYDPLQYRIGRGDKPSSCLLLYQSPLGAVAKRRLEILRETEDGFRIAEEDLRLRGAGEVLGTRQSGLPSLQLADLATHEELVSIAHDDARLVLELDPQLDSERGQALRTLLYLFRRDEAVQYLRAG